jgi:sulfate permease, SulP family
MESHQANPSIQSRFSVWLADELRPDLLLKSLATGFLVFILELIVVISFSALIFSGDLAGQLPFGLGFIMVGDAILCAVVVLLSSYRGSIAVEQDAPNAILALVAANLLVALPVTASPAQRLSTVVVMIAGTTIITGLIFLLLGIFKLGGLVRFLPYPVMGGFLAGTGWLLLTGGVGVMVETSLGLALLQPDSLLRWLPGLILGVVMWLAVNRFKNPLLLVVVFVAGIVLFYAAAWLMKIPISRLSAGGWLLGPFPTGSLWQFPLQLETLAQVNWPALVSQIPNLAPIALISVIALLLNANGLELLVKKDINLNHELVVAGVGNVAAGFTGGLVGYHTISLSSLNYTLSGNKRLPGLITSLFILLTVFMGAFLLGFIPKMTLGALLVFLGLSMLVEWVYQAWFKFPKMDFVIILLTLGMIAFRGFLQGIAVGLMITLILFIVRYSRVSVVHHAVSGASYHSRVTRSLRQREILEALGDQLYILQLQGFIFFGTANALFEQVRGRCHQASLPQIRFALLDFAQVTGLDSTGLLSFCKMLQMTQDCDVTLVLTGMNARIYEQFMADNFTDQPGILRFFRDIDHGVEWCEDEILAAAQTGQEIDISLQDHLEVIWSSPGQIEKLIQYMERREIASGDYLIRQGDEPELLFFIESGQVTAQLEQPGREVLRLETMHGGRTVGELGYYLGIKRTAAVVADQPTTVYTLSRQDLERIEKADPEVAHVLHRIIIHLLGERVIHLTLAVDALQR